ncbi:hypothetical protein GALMADRAFT_908498 [Galerina marginata CBS 339.88]|uniref:Bromo domain-containing protein n=1 Tax=Galerina marginata (strain CBS 339.88) TaxID=685588 RepID=A0A067SSM1_GALM3|nr:hypothetical protein GALMADRAFT_908498 [Galerina marginata CBS 339.88]
MNNLLRTLTESQVKPAADLRLLLTTVKEGRRQSYDTKLTDPFYDSLEGLLMDLKSITIDNHDAEAFLKPVSKTEVPDYHEVIQHPMDFQTMLKKVKQKQYKSKREFKDDLELIWSNCLTYNATENHPLRPCVKRLKVKAERLLKHITDRKERADPVIPSDLPSPTGGTRPRINGINGYLNGHSSHTRSPSITIGSKSATPSRASITIPARPRRDVPFSDTAAIIRTPEGMSMFHVLDREANATHPRSTLVHTLRELAPVVDVESDGEAEDAMVVDGAVAGDKRKLNGAFDRRPRKRARFTTQYPTPLIDEKDDLSQLWWGAVQSDTLLGSGLPGIPFGSSSSSPTRPKKDPSKRNAKRKSYHRQHQHPPAPQNPKSLLSMMNTNVKTMRRLRHTHAKFAALNATTAPPEDEEQGAETGMYGAPSGPAAPSAGRTAVQSFSLGDDDVVDDKIDEAPWILGRGKSKSKRRTQLSGVEIGIDNASDCLQWSTNKILEHAGFQGTSTVALDVLADVTAEYLHNVGRTIRFLSDKFGKTMTPEEIILHTLFESGSSKIQDLERYISDDIERYGSRLGELEKKLVGAYRETTAGELLEDEGLFESEDEEETGALAMGDFADVLGEDYLGLRAMGIADEFGLTNLSIPKKLLRGKKTQNKPTALVFFCLIFTRLLTNYLNSAKPTEPPPPYPPPPPFIPFTAGKVEDIIGLLKPYYQDRFGKLAASQPPPPAAASGPMTGLHPSFPPTGAALMLPPPVPGTMPPVQLPNAQPNPPAQSTINQDLVLPDELPNSAQMKMGPIGQIVKAGSASSAAKKKAKVGSEGGVAPGAIRGVGPIAGSSSGPGAAAPAGPSGAGTSGAAALEGSVSPKKKKANLGIGSGNGRKKKPDGPAPPGPGMGYGPGQGQGGPTLPAVVFASA